jgi:hypothetical protein
MKDGDLDKKHDDTYCSDAAVNRTAKSVISAIEHAGDAEPDFGGLQVEKMRKMATLAMKADPSNKEERFRPGSRLRTYTGVRSEDGSLKDETYGGEAVVKDLSTIYRNMDPLRYPQEDADLSRRGLPITGRFEPDGTFVEDAKGPETLYNEYVTDNPDHPKKKYGIDPKPGEWTEGLAQIPSYLVRIPEDKEELEIRAAGGKRISVRGGDYMVVDALGGGKTSFQAIEKNSKERTYRPWNQNDVPDDRL